MTAFERRPANDYARGVGQGVGLAIGMLLARGLLTATDVLARRLRWKLAQARSRRRYDVDA